MGTLRSVLGWGSAIEVCLQTRMLPGLEMAVSTFYGPGLSFESGLRLNWVATELGCPIGVAALRSAEK